MTQNPTDPLVSIVTCTYNSEKYIEESIESVAKQNYPAIEHIVIDAFSTDNTIGIVKKHPNVKIYKRKPQGISDAMNYGIEKASGEIIAFLHSDDKYLDAFSITKAVSAMQKSNKKWCFGKIEKLFEDGSTSTPEDNPYDYRKIFSKNPIAHPAVFMQKELFHDFGNFRTNLTYAMDIDLWLRIGKKHTPIQLLETLTIFRKFGGVSTKNMLNSRLECLKVYLNHIEGDVKLQLEVIGRFIQWAFFYVIKNLTR